VVAQLLRLKLALLSNTFRRPPAQLVGLLAALAYGLIIAGALTVGLISARSLSPDIARSVIICFGSLVVLASLLLPLAFGADDPLDPRRFALFGIETKRLALGLAVAALVSIPSIVVIAFALAQVVTWARDAASLILGLLAAVLIVGMCVLAARFSSAVASLLLSRGRRRDAAAIVLVGVLAVLAPLLAVLATLDWGSRGQPIVHRIAAVLTWTPFGAAWSMPADYVTGRGGLVPLKAMIAIVFVVALWLAWRWMINRMMATTDRAQGPRRYTGLGWFGRLPGTPTGAVAARSLSYWSRDARYRLALAVIPIVPIVMLAALFIAGVPPELLIWLPVPVMCLFLSWTVHNDVAHDSTAFWAHVSASLPGRADRWGRLAPVFGIGVPLVLLGSVTTSLISGNWDALPGLIGVSASLLLFGLGVSSVISAAFPYAAVHPGDSPFAQPQAADSSGSVVQSMSLFITLLAALPPAYFAFLGETVDPVWHFAALGAGLVLGLGSLILGVRWGASILDRKAPELLAFTLQN